MHNDAQQRTVKLQVGTLSQLFLQNTRETPDKSHAGDSTIMHVRTKPYNVKKQQMFGQLFSPFLEIYTLQLYFSSISFSLSLSICLSVHLPLSLYFSFSLFLSPSLSLFLCLSPSLQPPTPLKTKQNKNKQQQKLSLFLSGVIPSRCPTTRTKTLNFRSKTSQVQTI